MANNFKIAAFADEASSNFDEQIAAMLRNGVDMLEVRGVDGQNTHSLSVEKAREIKKKLNDAGLSMWSVGSFVGKNPITLEWQRMSDDFKHILEIAQITEAKCIRLFSFYETEGKPEFRGQVIEYLSRFVEMAKGSGIVICHENEKGIYGDVASRCLEIHKAVPGLKAVFDPANFIQCGQDTLEAWEMLKPYVHYLHIKDSTADGRVVLPGTGLGNLPAILKDYKDMASNVLTSEPHLYDFIGFKELEAGEKSKVGGLAFADSNEAFDCALMTLHDLVNAI